MRSSHRVDSSTLGWVKSEIDQTLAEARESLQQYRDTGDDLTPLRAFNNSVHQVAGTLQMVELDGAAQLAQEIESLATAVISGRIDGAAPPGLLDNGLDQLAAYMQRLSDGAPDRPLDNVELINELRRARQAEELDGYSLFRPELGIYPTRDEPVEELDGDEYFRRIRSLRQRFQGALLRWLRDQGDEEAWQTLADVVSELYGLSRFQVSMQIWWVARAYLDVMKNAELNRDDPRKHTLAKLDLLIRTLAEESEAAIAREGSEKLVRYMLYHIGISETATGPVREVVSLFELDALLGAEPGEAPLPEASVIAALRERAAEPLAAVRGALDECSRTGIAGEAFQASRGHLQAIAGAAWELGIEEVARVSDAVVQSLFVDDEPSHSEENLVASARALLFIEQTLDGTQLGAEWRREAAAVLEQLGSREELSDMPSMAIESHEIDTGTLESHELRRLVAAVAGQVEENLKDAERNLEHFARDASDTDSMTAVVSSLQQVHGAVRMLGQHKLCDLLETAIARIRELISGDAFPSDPLLDALAVTIGTTDAYVKGLERDAPNLEILLNRAVRELEAASSSGHVSIDPAETLTRIEETFDTWLADDSNYQAFNTLRRSLRDIGALAEQQGRFNLQGIAQEMINLLDIVMDDPAALTEEVEGTLRRSLSTLTELGGPMASPKGGDKAGTGRVETPQGAGSFEADDVVRATFAEEARECLAAIEEYLEALGLDPSDDGTLTDMRRGFHTIKGSGRMARAEGISELAWIVEEVLNDLMATGGSVPAPVLDFVSGARDELAGLLDRGLDSETDLSAWRERAATLDGGAGPDEPREASGSDGDWVDESWNWSFDHDRETSPDGARSPPAVTGFREDAGGPPSPVDDALAGDAGVRDAGEPVLQRIEDLGEQGHDLAGGDRDAGRASPFSDDEVIQIFSKEALSHIATIRAVVDECRRNGQAAINKEMLRAVHTLQGNARSLHLVEMSEAFTVLDSTLNARHSSSGASKDATLDEAEAEVLDALLIATAKVLDHLNRDKRFPEVVRQELVEIAGRIEATWSGPDGHAFAVRNALEGLDVVSDFAPAGGDAPAGSETGSDPGAASGSVFDELVDAERQDEPGDGDDATAIQAGAPQGGTVSTEAWNDFAPPPAPDSDEAAADDLASAELKDVFIEEAIDTLSRIESALQRAHRSGLEVEATDTLKRELHTLKGSSRAAGFEPIGDLSHDAESMLEHVAGAIEPPSDLLEILEEVHDTLANLVQGVEEDRLPDVDPRLVQRLRGGGPVPEGGSGERGGSGSGPSLIPEEGETGPASSRAAAAQPGTGTATDTVEPGGGGEMPTRGEAPRPTGGRSTVRIHSNVLDKLVNYAGEVSISRAQLEEQLSGLKGNLNELRGNVARFADQVRELDIQADTQIRSRISDEKISDAGDFDPLEMDRYSRLQQLSRSLSESVDDLVTIQGGLNRFAVQTEGVLSQQAMLNTELQDGLMSARMVPFNTLVPRLRHQARRTARELGKDIDFAVTGGELEVDRNILDQISEALEHMIRNSLDHGIEPVAVREAAGKPARGSVRIECRQEGNEVVLRFSDDGAGLDVERIKARAVEAGLLSPDSDLTDEEVIQLVVLSGFSTAPAVTQLSGRGVGLDVVNDAVRRLGGTLGMENRPGEGVSFDMRLPLSLSITQAMFVRCGDQRFAIPLGVIESVMKSEPENFSELSKDGDPIFRRDDRLYTLMDLTATLGFEPAATSQRIPVLLVRMGAREVAVRVDELVGTDEIVVKQLGDHLGRLSGINGATVTGDGSVVLILDVAELWLAQERLPAFRRVATRDSDAPPKVMVVDDSLTVRKVTGRNLGRHGMEVSMARDGLDALDQLAKVKPDVMLIDIEMPRMDGYELTTRIREDVNLRDIPIIVITSRAGSKHREKAMELGASAYLTKPYQERELLDEVNALLNRAPQSAVH